MTGPSVDPIRSRPALPVEDPELDPDASPATGLGRPATELADAEAIRRRHIGLELWIKVVGAWISIAAFVFGLAGVWSIALSKLLGRSSGIVATGAILVGIAMISGLLGHGLRRLRGWARGLIVGVLSLSLLMTAGVGGLAIVLGVVRARSFAPEKLMPLIGTFLVLSLIQTYLLYLMISKKSLFIFSTGYKSVIALTPHIKSRPSLILKILLGLFLVVLVSGLMIILNG